MKTLDGHFYNWRFFVSNIWNMRIYWADYIVELKSNLLFFDKTGNVLVHLSANYKQETYVDINNRAFHGLISSSLYEKCKVEKLLCDEIFVKILTTYGSFSMNL